MSCFFYFAIAVAGVSVFCGPAAARVAFREVPRDLQLFPRGAGDSAEIVFAGTITSPGCDSVKLEVDRDGELIGIRRAGLLYQGDTASFHLASAIHAELSEYTARFYLDDSLVAVRDSLVCGDVFLMDGQSNAVADDYGGVANGRSEWFRSFGTSSLDSLECRADTTWDLAQGRFSYAHAAVGCLGLAFGLSLTRTHGIPVAVLNGAVGGSMIEVHLRNEADPTDLGTIYGRLLWRCVRSGVRSHIRAILWHQGENDTFTDPMLYYDGLFSSLYGSWHQDYGRLERVYVFQLHPGCGGDYQPQMREIQRTLPDRYPDLSAMPTVGLNGHDGCHYDYGGYAQMARWLLGILTVDLYGSQDTWNIRAPDVQAAWFDSGHDEVRVLFDHEVRWPADTLNASMKDYFYVSGHGENAGIVSGRVLEDGRTISLILQSPVWQADRVSYLPAAYYPDGEVYEGPWVRNPRGIAALSFWGVPIQESSDAEANPAAAIPRLLRVVPNPFVGETKILLACGAGPARLLIFDAGGRTVQTLIAGTDLGPGAHQVPWDGRDDLGRPVGSGVFFARLATPAGRWSQAIERIR
jgi:hypothetical protein